MAWASTLFFVHLAALIGVVTLYRRAPCWMQKLSIFGLIVAMTAATLAYSIALAGFLAPHWGWIGSWEIFGLGLMIEHTAVLLMIFRLVFQQKPVPKEEAQWPNSLASFPNSRG